MIIGIGTDIIEISRVERAVNRTPGFLNKVFSEVEIKTAGKRMESLAGYFAAKEAFGKALGIGISGFSLIEVWVQKDPFGKPFLRIKGKAEKLCLERGVERIHLSISHSKDKAIAFVILEGLEDETRK